MQEIHWQASQHLQDYLRTPDVPFYLWLRGVATNISWSSIGRTQKLRARRCESSVGESLRLENRAGLRSRLHPRCLAKPWHPADTGTSPSNAAMKAEWKSHIEEVVDSFPPRGKRILALCGYFEQPAHRSKLGTKVLSGRRKAAGCAGHRKTIARSALLSTGRISLNGACDHIARLGCELIMRMPMAG